MEYVDFSISFFPLNQFCSRATAGGSKPRRNKILCVSYLDKHETYQMFESSCHLSTK